MKLHHFFVAILLVVMLWIAWASFFEGKQWRRMYTIELNQEQYRAVGSLTPAQHAQGLSNRDYIGADGMLFLFDQENRPTFWMKDMRFALDFIWIKDDRVVDIHERVQPPSDVYTRRFVTPSKNVDSVLEVPAGFVDEHNITIGTHYSRLPIWFLAAW